MAVTTGPHRPRDQGTSYRHSAKSFERDGASTPPCRRVRSNAVGPVTQRASLSSGCAASLLHTDITFDGQNNAGNSRRCDTQVHAADIVGFFGAGRIRMPAIPVMNPVPQRHARGLHGVYAQWPRTFQRPVMRQVLSFLSLAPGREHPFYNGCHGARFNSPTGM